MSDDQHPGPVLPPEHPGRVVPPYQRLLAGKTVLNVWRAVCALRSAACRQVLGLKRTASRARGIADSMEGGPAFEMPSRQVLHVEDPVCALLFNKSVCCISRVAACAEGSPSIASRPVRQDPTA